MKRGATKTGPGLVILLVLLFVIPQAGRAAEVILKDYEDYFLITDTYSPWEPTCWGKIKNISSWHRGNVTIIVEPYGAGDRKMAPQVIEIGLMGVNAEEDFRWHPPLGMKHYRYLIKGN